MVQYLAIQTEGLVAPMMFWKGKKVPEPEMEESPTLSDVATTICQAKFANLDLRRAVLDWRDTHTENVEMHLARELTSLYAVLDNQLEEMDIKDLFLRKGFAKEHFEPIYNEWLEREVSSLVRTAQKDLNAVFSHALEYGEQGVVLEHEGSAGHYSDAAIAAAVTGAGLAAIPTITGLSVVSAGGILGLIGITTVAWPIAATGAIAASALLAFGGYKAAGLRSNAIERYRKTIRQSIENQILGYNTENESVRQRLQTFIDETANKLLLEIDQ